MTTTATSLFPFSVDEQNTAEANFGLDAEYYEQDGQTFAIQFTEMDSDYPMCEAFAIARSGSRLVPVETPVNEFDWESAEQFRGEKFPG